jgi:hypothetical protein
MDTQLYESNLRVERKQFTFEVKENPKGTFLRITESGHDHYNTIIIPGTGLELFRDSLNEVIKSNKTPMGSGTVVPLGQQNTETPTLDGPAGLTTGS